MSVPAGFGSFMTGSTNYAIPGVNEKNQDATVYVGNLDNKVDEELLWELFIQCGPVATVSLPRDRITNCHQGFAFVEYKSTDDADYAIKVLNMVRLFGKPIRCNKSAVMDKSGKSLGVGGSTTDSGAHVFVGGLSVEIDEPYLQDTFSSFGPILFAKVVRDPDTLVSKGYGFVAFDTFAAADSAIAAMNGQYLGNKPISLSFAQKKDRQLGSSTETHGSAAERLMADLKRAPVEQTTPMPPPLGHVPRPTSFFPPPPPPRGFMPPPPPPR